MDQRTLSLTNALLRALPEDMTDRAVDFWIDHDSELAKILLALKKIPFRLVTFTGAHHESGGGNVVVDAMIAQSRKGREVVLVLPIEEADLIVTDNLNYRQLNFENITVPVIIILSREKTTLNEKVQRLIKAKKPIYTIPLSEIKKEFPKLFDKVVKKYYDDQNTRGD